MEQWVDKVQQLKEEEARCRPPDPTPDPTPDLPPDLPPSKPREMTSRRFSREEVASLLEDSDEDYAELPEPARLPGPIVGAPSYRDPIERVLPDPADPDEVQLPTLVQPEPLSEPPTRPESPLMAEHAPAAPEEQPADTMEQPEEVREYEFLNQPETNIDGIDLLSDKEFERLEQQLLETTIPSAPSKESSNELLSHESTDFPFQYLLDQLDEYQEPEMPATSTLPAKLPSTFQHSLPSAPLPPQPSTLPAKLPSSLPSESPSLQETDSVGELADEQPTKHLVSRLSSLDKLETWDSGLEESLKRTSQFLKEATQEHDHLVIDLGNTFIFTFSCYKQLTHKTEIHKLFNKLYNIYVA